MVGVIGQHEEGMQSIWKCCNRSVKHLRGARECEKNEDLEVLQHYDLENGGAASRLFVGSRSQSICRRTSNSREEIEMM